MKQHRYSNGLIITEQSGQLTAIWNKDINNKTKETWDLLRNI